ncbi:AraC family transcriptional regulator [Paenibacillus swuensis]|uniref:AraC family transcriptional regulator n=1 Tax=Paenibacillus swuensis TaxID=1178515 RepID=A0A172TGR4_9BACL|nr:AraC family transcriptional regulator [Paenibacillus swuensis]ANE46152.1 AraC family transcriptional regulator [Paenibacillus swuensis]
MPNSSFSFARMEGKWDALDRLDLQFRWGGFGIRVLHCHLTQFPPGNLIPFHQHSEFELHFIPKGKGTVNLAGVEYELHEGMFYITAPGVLHQQWSDEQDPMYELCLHCDITPLPQSVHDAEDWGFGIEHREAEQCIEMLRTLPSVPVADRFHAMGCFLDAYKVWEEQKIGFYTSLKAAITQILLRSVRVFSADEYAAGGIPERNMSVHRFERAKQYIDDNASRPVSLDEVATVVGISPRQLQRIFRDEGKITFRGLLEQVRLTRICSDLLTGDRNVEEIALANGYNSTNYLFPVFKQKYGMTPTEYRRLNQQA